MGVKGLGKLITKKSEISLESLNKKIVAIDTYNVLYQFLSSIRGGYGDLLSDAEGRVTSHLGGLFFRTLNFAKAGMRPLFVFDGKPIELKKSELERRKEGKRLAEARLKDAKERGDIVEIRKYAKQTTKLGSWEIESSKELLKTLGFPYLTAPNDAEAYAADLTGKNLVDGVGTQDYDCLLFGAPIMIKNLTLTGKRRYANTSRTVTIHIERIHLDTVLEELQLNRRELVDLSILLGTDFNPDGFKGIGPKTAMKLIKKYNTIEEIEKQESKVTLDFDVDEVRNIFLKPRDVETPKLVWEEIDRDKTLELMVEQMNFNRDRITSALDAAIREINKNKKQKALDTFFA